MVGGQGNGGAALKSVELYDVSAGQWRALPDMSVKRQACAAVCIDGNVYVMGGNDGGSCFFGEAVLMMELPRRHSTPPGGGGRI